MGQKLVISDHKGCGKALTQILNRNHGWTKIKFIYF